MTFKVSCEICVLEFSNLEILKLHNIKTHEDAKGLKQCHLCDRKVEKFNALKAHIEKEHTDHGEKKHCCEICDESFIFRSSLNIHRVKHKDELGKTLLILSTFHCTSG